MHLQGERGASTAPGQLAWGGMRALRPAWLCPQPSCVEQTHRPEGALAFNAAEPDSPAAAAVPQLQLRAQLRSHAPASGACTRRGAGGCGRGRGGSVSVCRGSAEKVRAAERANIHTPALQHTAADLACLLAATVSCSSATASWCEGDLPANSAPSWASSRAVVPSASVCSGSAPERSRARSTSVCGPKGLPWQATRSGLMPLAPEGHLGSASGAGRCAADTNRRHLLQVLGRCPPVSRAC